MDKGWTWRLLRRTLLLSAVALTILQPKASAQTPYRLKDIQPGAGSSFAGGFARLGNMVLFSANDGVTVHGSELWRSDGTEAGTVLVKDIRPGSSSSSPVSLVAAAGLVFFIANDGSGNALWRTDGTAAGTIRLTDTSVGSAVANGLRSVVDVSGTLLFEFHIAGTGEVQLWRTEGTVAGTELVKGSFLYLANFTSVDGTLFFRTGQPGASGEELWKSDGSEAGTLGVRAFSGIFLGSWASLGGKLYFQGPLADGGGLWRSDGTEAGTVQVHPVSFNLGIGTLGSPVVGGQLFFVGDHSSAPSYELWKTDGSTAGTVPVKDVWPGASVALLSYLTPVGNTMYFTALSSNLGYEPWTSDGTEPGTALLKDIYPAAGQSGAANARYIDVDGTAYFVATDGVHGTELWTSDGTAVGTTMVADINPGLSSGVDFFTGEVANGRLFFRADDGTTGSELWALPLGTMTTLSISDVTVSEGNAGTVDATFTVTLSSASSDTVTVDYETADDTATAGSDYVSASGTLTFLPGETSQTVTVTVNGDTDIEPDETFFVNLSNATNATISDAQGVGTITNDDTPPVPAISIDDVSVSEGDAGTTDAVFTVSLSVPTVLTVTVAYATANGTATAGSDYTAASGMLSFLPGETSKQVTVPVLGDTVGELDETFFVNLSNPTAATIADGQGQGTILNDDPPEVSISDASVVEGATGTKDMVFTVSLSIPAPGAVSVAYETADGTATAGEDYVAASGVVDFATGETSKPISVSVIGDLTPEPNETFYVNLSGPSGAVLGDAEGVGTIVNDEGGRDFNGDGHPDILWHNQATGGLYTWFLGGTNGVVTQMGSFLTPSKFADTQWQIRGIADFNGDGHPDVLWHHQVTGALYVWFLGGSNGVVTQMGSFLTPNAFSNTQWQIRGLADFNGDGQPDILWHNQVTGGLYVWFLGGTNGVVTQMGSFLTPNKFADTQWQIRGIADFDGDGFNDILWHHQGNGSLYVWFLGGTNGIVTQNGSYLTPSKFADTNWKIVQVADFNGDGNVDLLWHHQVTGALYVWFLGGTNGIVTQNGSYLTPSAFSDTNWKVVPR